MFDWQALLEGRSDGLTLYVDGARIGDDVGTLPVERITQIETSGPSGRRSWRAGGAQAAGEASEAGGGRAAPLADLREREGRVYIEGSAFQIVRGKVEKVWLRGSALANAPFATEADIGRSLGPPLGVERKLGWRVYHYPERALSVAWASKQGRLEHVALGAVAWHPPSFGASELLGDWMAAARAGLAPTWGEPPDRASSLWVRYARVSALLRAFGLGTPQEFAEGGFLKGRSLDAHPRSLAVLRSLGPDSPAESGRWHRGDLDRFFWWLLTYRTNAEGLLAINKGWLCADFAGLVAAIQLSERANAGVRAALGEVDALLCDLISPDGSSVPEAELIARWGFPDIDLDDLLADEL